MTVHVAVIEPVGGHGGMNFYDAALCRSVVQAGGRATLFTCDATEVTGQEGFPVRRPYRRIYGQGQAWLRGLRYLWGSLQALPGARWRGHRVVHFHFFHVGPLELFNVLLARAVGLRVVITAHDVEALRQGLQTPRLLRWAYRLAHRVIAHSQVARRELTDELGIAPDKLDVIPHGNYVDDVPADLTRARARARLGLSPDQRVLLFFGQIKDVKGLDVLLQGFALARQHDPRLHLLIAGKVWKTSFARYQALIDSHELGAHCTLHIRYIPDAEVPLFYRSADLVVLPYRRIYQSGVVLQAMSHGCPVLVSDIEGMLEAVDDERNGFVFRCGDAAHLATRLAEIFALPGRAEEIGRAGLRTVTERNDWTRVGARVLNCYEHALHPERAALQGAPGQPAAEVGTRLQGAHAGHAGATARRSGPAGVVRILGTRGIPAAHGGFETFAEKLALHLVGQGWRVVVYCQEDGDGLVSEDRWQGVERVRIPIRQSGPKGTILFDWKATVHAARHRDLCLTLGYNTAVFCALLRLKGIPNLINMDGIEWSRAKWGPVAKTWFWLNERAGCWLGNHLIADHPQIKAHLQTRVRAGKITTIPYGADEVRSAPLDGLTALGLVPRGFVTLIARAEPENSVLEVVRGFSARPRGLLLVVLGHYEADNAYHRSIRSAAGPEVRFVGAIYDQAVVQALRFHCVAYVHGHQVGGTNPSLVEAMGAGNPIVAHDNRFNRWVAGEGAAYFHCAASFSALMDELLPAAPRLDSLRQHGMRRFRERFLWGRVLHEYEDLLTHHLPRTAPVRETAASGSGPSTTS